MYGDARVGDRGGWLRRAQPGQVPGKQKLPGSGVDIKYPEYEPSPSHEFELSDLRRLDSCPIASRGIDEVYHLAADMGG